MHVVERARLYTPRVIVGVAIAVLGVVMIVVAGQVAGARRREIDRGSANLGDPLPAKRSKQMALISAGRWVVLLGLGGWLLLILGVVWALVALVAD